MTKKCNNLLFCISICTFLVGEALSDGILYPQQSEKRNLNQLDGLWNFRVDRSSNQNQGFDEEWFKKPLSQSGEAILMPVPSSYNDITQDASLRDHIGWVWYDREVYVAESWNAANVFIRFGSANYHSIVWMNGKRMVEHSGGFLPFKADVTSSIIYGGLNQITLALNNTLTDSTLPQGSVDYFNNTAKYPPGYKVQNYDFDWFNYAGIHRPVYLYTVPKSAYIDDINTTMTINGNTGIVSYSIGLKGSNTAGASIDVSLYDQDGNRVSQTTSQQSGFLMVNNPHLWWPRGMSSEVGYLYTLHAQVNDRTLGSLIDSYRLRIGIRTLNWDANNVYINGKAIYFKGFGRHEDSIIRGRGVDMVTLIKDFNLLKWTGANSFRTSHYPYSEELMDLADEQGFMIIDEVAACTMSSFGSQMLINHKTTMEEFFNRDKNRPSVVMWSVANEATTDNPNSQPYFYEISAKARQLDTTRPITIVINKNYNADLVGQYFDVICINRYYAWYDDEGLLYVITQQIVNDVNQWRQKYKLPVMVTEYGADTYPGLHQNPSFIWTEEFQVDFLTQYFNGFDELYQKGQLIGEMIWNFADFATKPNIRRIVGNRKGILTRDRQPKASAYHLMKRYTTLIR